MAECSKVVDLAADTGGPTHSRGHVGLSPEPGEDAVGQCVVAAGAGLAVTPQGERERWRAVGDRAQPRLHQLTDLRVELRLGCPGGQHVFFEREAPALEYRS